MTLARALGATPRGLVIVASVLLLAWTGVVVARPSYGWIALAALLAGVAWGAWALPSGIFVPVVARGPLARDPARRVVALTFDDGPDPESTPRVLAALSAHGAKATFFLIGAKARQHPELVLAIRSAGHELGVHGDAHSWRALLTPARAEADLRAACAAVEHAGGGTPWLVRPPYGVSTPGLAAAAVKLGLTVVAWSRRAFDTQGSPSEARAAALAARLRPGDIVLLHDAPERCGAAPPAGVQMLPALLAALAARMMSITSVGSLIGSTAKADLEQG